MTTYSPIRHIGTGFCLTLCLTALPGCGSKSSTSTKAKGEKSAQRISVVRCRSQLENTLRKVTPGELGRGSRATNAAMGLNDWFKKCASGDWQKDWGGDFAGLVAKNQMIRATSDRFSDPDAEYIRTSILARNYAEAATKGVLNERDRIMRIFYGLTEQIACDDPQDAIRVSPYEILARGRGTVEDFAWVLATVLRQLHIDTVLLKPTEDGTKGLLIGVRSESDLLLFDPHLRLPIHKPGKVKRLLPHTPATLKEVLADPSILDHCYGDADYAISADQIKNADILIVGNPSTWSQRCLLLQDAMKGAILCDPLEDLGQAPGLVSRAVKAGGGVWDKQRVKIWDYPAQQLRALASADEATQKKVTAAMAPLGAPLPWEDNFSTGTRAFESPSWTLLEARIELLSGGDTREVVSRMTKVKMGQFKEQTIQIPSDNANDPPNAYRIPDEVFQLHQNASALATLWLAIYHMSGDDRGLEEATNTLWAFRARHPKNAMLSHANTQLAAVCARTADFKKAKRVIGDAINSASTDTRGLKLLEARLVELLGEESEKEKPADDAAKDDQKSSELETSAKSDKPAPVKDGDDEKGAKSNNEEAASGSADEAAKSSDKKDDKNRP